MGISLFGLTPSATYPSLIKFGDNSAISGVLRALSDGLGNDLPMQVSTAGVNFTGTLTVGGAGLSPVSGVSGAIQFSNGSAFASDAANFFWDNTNKRLGIGTNAPSGKVHFITDDCTTPTSFSNQTSILAGTLTQALLAGYSSTNGAFLNAISPGVAWYKINYGALQHIFSNAGNVNAVIDSNTTFGNGTTSLGARLGIKGSGSTSATTSLLVQNSAGTASLTVRDNGSQLWRADVWNGFDTYGVANFSGSMYIKASANTYIQNSGGTEAITVSANSVGIYTSSPNASAILDVNSTTRGFLPPRMTTTQRDAIVTPATGLRIYNTTTNTNDTYNGTAWQSNSVSGVSGAIQFSNGSAFASDAANFFWDNTNKRLGIGTNAPAYPLEVIGGAFNVIRFKSQFTASGTLFTGNTQVGMSLNTLGNGTAITLNSVGVGIKNSGDHTATATLDVKGSGSTSATTSLLVQNSAGTNAISVKDNGSSFFGPQSAVEISNIISVSAQSGNQNLIQSFGGVTSGTTFRGGLDTSNVNFEANTNGGVFRSSGTTAQNATAVLDLQSTTRGFLPPRMTTTQKNAIATPAAGLVVYDSTVNKLFVHNGVAWEQIQSI